MKGKKLTGFRKIADAQWSAPNDPQIYGAMDVDATNLLAFMHKARDAGHKLTPTHFVGRAVARALHDVPDLNVRILAGRAIPRPTVDIFYITAVEGGRDLSGAKIERTDEKSIFDVATELREKAQALKARKDPTFKKSKKMGDSVPSSLLHVLLRLAAFITGDLDLGIPQLGVTPRPFGSAMVSSVGMLGLPMGFAPLTWMYKVAVLVLAGEIADKPVAIQGKVEVRPMLPICATIDHRYADGWHISQMVKPFRAYLENPAAFEPEI